MKAPAFARQHKGKLFWSWIAYQTIKGLLTTTFIWVPLWAAWKSGLAF